MMLPFQVEQMKEAGGENAEQAEKVKIVRIFNLALSDITSINRRKHLSTMKDRPL